MHRNVEGFEQIAGYFGRSACVEAKSLMRESRHKDYPCNVRTSSSPSSRARIAATAATEAAAVVK